VPMHERRDCERGDARFVEWLFQPQKCSPIENPPSVFRRHITLDSRF
jgi:hypothetical protein